MKVSFFEKKVRLDFIKIISAFSSVISVIFLFLPDFCQCVKYSLLVVYLSIIVIIYLAVFIYHKIKKSLKLKINNTTVNIFFGDIFMVKGLKVIAFNEYFDTIVDDDIISSNSLNGILINKEGIENIDNSLKKDENLRYVEVNYNRIKGKKYKYSLGTIHKYKDYFLVAFSRFNKNNKAELLSNEYAKCLLEMWKNLNEKYSQEKVFVPLLGSGITRIVDNSAILDQELLEIMLSTLKISKQTFKKPSSINIVLQDNKLNYENFNFARLKEMFK